MECAADVPTVTIPIFPEPDAVTPMKVTAGDSQKIKMRWDGIDLGRELFALVDGQSGCSIAQSYQRRGCENHAADGMSIS